MMALFKRSSLATAVLALLLGSIQQVAAIYPDDHWTYSTQLTEATFDGFIQDAIAGGKTAFVHDVVFGDVNLSEEPIRGNYSPGAGGWPTIRYFNKETGPDGAPYSKKTSMSMCDELGPKHDYMEEYIEEAGNTSLCNVQDGTNCDDKSKAYIEKQKAKTPADWKTQMERLVGLEGKEMKDDLKAWVKQRKKILRALLANHAAAPGEL